MTAPPPAEPAPPAGAGGPGGGAPRPQVVAVLVTHDGAAWLPRALAGLQAQTRAPDRVVVVDTGSWDDSVERCEDALGDRPGVRYVRLPRLTGYGAAVAAGVEAADRARAAAASAAARRHTPQSEWVWLLHDDCEPEPDALAALLRATAAPDGPDVVGPKVRGWRDRRQLLEAGTTVSRGGRRETGLERGERDQGQHDTRLPGGRRVLAVGSAGLLVRRTVWDDLGGFDPALTMFRDDLDFCWRAHAAGHRVTVCTDAVVHHAEAAARHRRPLAAGGRSVHLLDRRHALYALLVNLPLTSLLLAVPRLVLSTAGRAVLLLLGKLPGAAAAEVGALGLVLGRTDLLVRGRWRRRRTRRVRARAVTPLLASRLTSLRHLVDGVAGLGAAAAAGVRSGAGRAGLVARGRVPAAAPEPGPVADEAESLETGDGLRWRAVLRSPALLLPLLLLGVVLVGLRGLPRGTGGLGALQGGALLPAPTGAFHLFREYVGSWHAVGLGSGRPAPAYLVLVGALGTVLLGSAAAAAVALTLGAVPLAGLSAYLATRSTGLPRPLRSWAAATYALLPAVPAAAVTGRVGTALLAVLLPPTLVAAAAATRAAASWRAAWLLALLVAAVLAAAPSLVPAAAVLLLGGLLVLPRRWRLLPALLAPPVLLAPGLPELWARPGLLGAEPGVWAPGLADPDLPPLAAVLLHPGGPGSYPVLLSAGLVAAALAAIVLPARDADGRPRVPAAVLLGWLVALVGTVSAVAHSRLVVDLPAGPVVPGWPGPSTLLAGAGLVVAATAGASGLRARLGRTSFGWRQAAVPVVVVLALAGTAGTAAAIGQRLEGPLRRGPDVALPAFVAAEARQPAGVRTLVLRPGPPLRYALLRSGPPTLGQGDVAITGDRADRAFAAVVADLLSGRGGDAPARLRGYAARYVLLASPAEARGPVAAAVAALTDRLDGTPGLRRVSTTGGDPLWRVEGPVRRLEQGTATVRLAERADAGWRGSAGGIRLPSAGPAAPGFGPTWRLPATVAGAADVRHDDRGHRRLLGVQLGGLALVALLLLPRARRHEEEV